MSYSFLLKSILEKMGVGFHIWWNFHFCHPFILFFFSISVSSSNSKECHQSISLFLSTFGVSLGLIQEIGMCSLNSFNIILNHFDQFFFYYKLVYVSDVLLTSFFLLNQSIFFIYILPHVLCLYLSSITIFLPKWTAASLLNLSFFSLYLCLDFSTTLTCHAIVKCSLFINWW